MCFGCFLAHQVQGFQIDGIKYCEGGFSRNVQDRCSLLLKFLIRFQLFVCTTSSILILRVLEEDIEFVGIWLEVVTQVATSSIFEPKMFGKQTFETTFESSVSTNTYSGHFTGKPLRNL